MRNPQSAQGPQTPVDLRDGLLERAEAPDLVLRRLQMDNTREALLQGLEITADVMRQICDGVPGPLGAKPVVKGKS